MENAETITDENNQGRTEEVKTVDVDGEKVSYKEFKSLKDEMHKRKDEARKYADELKALKEKDMRDKEQWKEFGSTKEKEANEWKTKYEVLNSTLLNRAKLTAVQQEALKLGMVETALEDLELMDLKGVIVETTSTGKVNVIGARSEAERIKGIRPHWFSSKNTPNVNTNLPGVKNSPAGLTSYEDLMKLEKEAQKSGDYTEYKKRVMEFKQKK